MNSEPGVKGPGAPRRTLLLSTGAFSDDGGIQAYNRLLIKALRELGQSRDSRLDVLLLRDVDADVDSGYRALGHGELTACAGSTLRFSLRALRKVLLTRPDLTIHGHLNFAPLALALGLLRPRVPQWFVVYGAEAWGRLPALKRLAARRASRILSISDYTRDSMALANEISPERITVLPCAIDSDWAARAGAIADVEAQNARPVLLTVGRLDASEGSKGVSQVIRALPLTSRYLPEVRYVVVGAGTGLAPLRQLAEQLGVASRVEFRGRVDRPALARAYEEAALYVMPSKLEGFGIAFIEAGLFGKPSLAGNAGGTPEVVLDGVTGKLVDPDDVEAIAEQAVGLLARPEVLKRMGRKARERAMEEYSYEVFRGRVAALFASRASSESSTELG